MQESDQATSQANHQKESDDKFETSADGCIGQRWIAILAACILLVALFFFPWVPRLRQPPTQLGDREHHGDDAVLGSRRGKMERCVGIAVHWGPTDVNTLARHASHRQRHAAVVVVLRGGCLDGRSW